MADWKFTKGLHELGNGNFAYLQPDGSWGWSNAGLVTDGDDSLLVDTLFDAKLTAEMLESMRKATPAAQRIGALVNTHSNGDHCYGNALVGDIPIIAARASAEEMAELTPGRLAELMRATDEMGPAGEFLARIFEPFDFENIAFAPPTETFEGTATRTVGAKEVRLIDVGPAHTRGDVLVHVPADRVVYTGDILFIDGTPVMWEGPVGNWIRACDLIIDMDAEAIVPGHGPITDRAGVRAMRDYLVYVRDETRQRYAAGLSAADAARDIALEDYSAWSDAERIAVNVHTLYREFSGGEGPRPGTVELFRLMAELAR
ncbi:MAG: MBL fold metallo-hydrolase [Myxococcota bacterium]